MIALPVFAGLITGTADEGLQWFIPNRYGELRDVFLNLVAIACGLLVTFALLPPPAWSWRLAPASRRRVVGVGLATTIIVAAFTWVVHAGALVGDDQYGFDHVTRPVNSQHWLLIGAVRWSTSPPSGVPRLFSREDQYLTEGLWHVQARNTAWDANDIDAAWGENVILGEYFRTGSTAGARMAAGPARRRRTPDAGQTPSQPCRTSLDLDSPLRCHAGLHLCKPCSFTRT